MDRDEKSTDKKTMLPFKAIKTSYFIENGFFFEKNIPKELFINSEFVDDIISYKESTVFVIFDLEYKLEFCFLGLQFEYFSVEKYNTHERKGIFIDDFDFFSLNIYDIKKFFHLKKVNEEEYMFNNIRFFIEETGDIFSIFQI